MRLSQRIEASRLIAKMREPVVFNLAGLDQHKRERVQQQIASANALTSQTIALLEALMDESEAAQ